jgi:dTDP-4-amino-4,6-dideoxygalactose transaminase
MWPRKQLDIGWRDLAYAVAQVFLPGRRPADEQVAGTYWIPAKEGLVTLSVRTGWDLLLTALHLPEGSEVIMSAVTVPDMARIVRHHGLVPIPVDVDAETLEPVLSDIERAITGQTRMILVAHLFGARIDMGPIIRLARAHDLLVVEDCAQAYVGREYAGHPESDVAMFSFGPIKTATALGGAVLRVRDQRLRDEMARRERSYPMQSRWYYWTRLLKYAVLKLISGRRIYGLIVRACGALGIDHDQKFATIARSFSANGFFEHIRHQPCVPLVRLLARRIATFEQAAAEPLRRRSHRGQQVASGLAGELVPGGANPTNTYWVLPVRLGHGNGAIAELQAAGFDATARSSLVVVSFPENGSRKSAEADHAEGRAAAGGNGAPTNGAASNGNPPAPQRLAPWLEETVFLPNGDAMTSGEFERMRAILDRALANGHGRARAPQVRGHAGRAGSPAMP